MTIDKDLHTQLAYYEDDNVWETPELEESTYNPANDEFKRVLQSIKLQIRHLSLKMRPRHAMMVKLYVDERSYTNVAARLATSTQTVATVCKSPDGVRLRQLLAHHNQLVTGVSAIEREQLLWRIALNNELKNPRTSISAVAEINKMKADTEAFKVKLESERTISESPQVIIQLADPRLLPSPLDIN
jgi:hypothetical protein